MTAGSLMRPFRVLTATVMGMVIVAAVFVTCLFCFDTYDLKAWSIYARGNGQRVITVEADMMVFGMGVGIKSESKKIEDIISKKIFSLIERYKDSDDFKKFGDEVRSVIREFGEENHILIHINRLNYWFGS